jgi:ubiquinone/menaquinone biosynthesis C-methylase UbiE
MRFVLRALTAVLLAVAVGLIARRSGRAHGRRWLRAADQRLEKTTLRSRAGASVYARVARGIFRRLNADVVARARDASARSVLDVGSEPGELAIRLARQLPTGQIIGIDPSAPMIEVAARRAAQLGPTPVAVHFVRAVGEQLPFPSHSFDLVVSTAALHHFRDPRPGAQ